MGPTLQSAPISLESPSSSNKETTNKSSQEVHRGKMRILKVPLNNAEKQAEEIKYVISIVSKLSTPSTNSNLVYFEKLGFEGSDAEENSKIFEIPYSNEVSSSDGNPVIEQQQNYLRVFVEQYEFQTLQEWLSDRENCLLHVVQVNQMIIQLITALRVLVEVGINEIRQTISFENIHVVHECENLPEDYVPHLKFAFLNVEKLLNSCAKQDLYQPTNLLQRIASLWLQLLTKCVKNSKEGSDLKLEYSEELNLINELLEFDCQNFSTPYILSIIGRIENIAICKQVPILLNLTQAPEKFIGRLEEMKQVETVIDEHTSNIIMIHGDPGSGKTAFMSHLNHILITKNFNILCFDAASTDSLTVSLRTCAAYRKLQLGMKDHSGGSKLLKNIFGEIQNLFKLKKLLIILENAEYPSGDIMELIHEFDENVRNDRESFSNHCLLLTMEERWTTESEVIKQCSSFHLKPLENQSCQIFFQDLESQFDNDGLMLQICPDIEPVQEILPAALGLISSHMCTSSIHDLPTFLQNVKCYKAKHVEVGNWFGSDLFSLPLLYTMSVQKIYDSLNGNHKELFREVLSFLQNIDGHYGMHIGLMDEILRQSVTDSESCTTALPQILTALKQYFLIDLRSKMIRLSNWMQDSLKTSIKFLTKGQRTSTFKGRVLATLRGMLLSPSEAKWQVVPHVIQTWINLCRKDKNLANRFDDVPELIVNVAKKEDKLDCVISFLKEVSDILTSDDSSTYDYRVLKLNFVLAKDYLLSQSRLNEAFQVFKIVNDHSRTEPREFLMLKLKSLIELGQLYIAQQDYEKAISCFQQVQIFAVQKIHIIELDSDPTVLKARMMHGYANVENGRLEEGKKILLPVIPLLERYTGPEEEEIRRLLIQGKFYLAVLLRQNGDLVNALMMQKKILKEREKLFGRKHPDTWASKREMALLYSSYDNHERALVILRSLLEVQEEVLGAPSNRQSLATMNAIAEIEAKLGNFDDALELYEAIDLIQQEVLSDNDEMKISSQLNQAEVLMSLGQYKEATDIFDLVYALKSTKENKTSQDIALCENIVRKREKAGRSMEILGNYWLSLTPQNVDDPAELSSLAKKHEVATELSENQDYHGALRFLREVLEDCGSLDEVNRFHLNVKADMARVLGLVGKYNESFSFYKDIIPLLDATFGETDELTMLCKDTMGQVFLFSGNQFLKRQMSNLKWFLF